MIFKMDELYVKNPALGKPMIKVQGDDSANGKPWVRNSINVDGKPVPRYRLKDGVTLGNTPAVYMDQVEEITDYSQFKKGDVAPAAIGIREATWGGSRDDIITHGKNSDGTWTIEMSRKLDTGNSDDVSFTGSRQDYPFVIIVRDDEKGYAISKPVALMIEW